MNEHTYIHIFESLFCSLPRPIFYAVVKSLLEVQEEGKDKTTGTVINECEQL